MGKLLSFFRAKQADPTLPTLQENTLWLANDGYDEIDDDWCLEFGFIDINPAQFHRAVTRLIESGLSIKEARIKSLNQLLD